MNSRRAILFLVFCISFCSAASAATQPPESSPAFFGPLPLASPKKPAPAPAPSPFFPAQPSAPRLISAMDGQTLLPPRTASLDLPPEFRNSPRVNLTAILVEAGNAPACPSTPLLAFPQQMAGARNSACHPRPLSVGGKFVYFLKNTYGPLPLLTVAFGAAWGQALDSDPGYGQGGWGYARRVADGLGSRSIKNFVGPFLVASLLRQDPQYHPSPYRGFGTRLGYAVKHVFVTRTDSGGEAPSYWNIAGNFAYAGVSQSWLRASDRGVGNFFSRLGTGFAFDIAVNVFREFVLCRKADRK